MTVSVQTPFKSAVAAGSATFVYDFRTLDASYLVVKVDGVLKTLTTDYTVTGVNAQGGGTVVFGVAPTVGAVVTIQRKTPFQRSTDYQTNGDFMAGTVNPDFDALWMALQDSGFLSGLALQIDPAASLGVSTTVPAPVAGSFIGWNSLGTALQNYAGLASSAVSTFMASVVAATSAAAARLGIGAAASGANTDITSLAAVTSINSGPFATNVLSNANFDIWQRGVSFNSNGWTADRWYNAGLLNATMSRTAGLDGISKYGFAITSSSASNSCTIQQPIEQTRVRLLQGKNATFSLACLTTAGTASVTIAVLKNATADTNTAGAWTQINSTTFTATTGLTRGSVTVAVPSDTTAEGLKVTISTSGQSSGATLVLYQAQLEPGSVTTAMVNLPYSLNLADCKRFYEKSYSDGTNPGTATSAGASRFSCGPAASGVFGVAQFSVEKRVSPTVRTWDEAGNLNRLSFYSAGGFALTNNLNALASNWGGTTSWGFSASTSTAGASGTYTVHWDADAEFA